MKKTKKVKKTKKPTTYIKNLGEFLDKYYPSLTPNDRAKRILMAEIRVALDKYFKTTSAFRDDAESIFIEILRDLRGFSI
ncbi:Uncharacterised protein [uncultured archaeon]|nr:Uncharacterised protein [uncultured archaeon]